MVYIHDPSFFLIENKRSEENPHQNKLISAKYPVCEGEIIHTHKSEGNVVLGYEDLYIEYFRLNWVTDSNYKMQKAKGDYIAPGEVLYTYKGKDKTVDFNGKILDVVFSKEGYNQKVQVKILNYDKLYIVTSIPSEKINSIDYSSTVYVIYNDERYLSSICGIGYEIEDGELPIYVTLPEKLYPGSEVIVEFTTGVQPTGMYVSKEAVYQLGESYFADIETEDGIKQVEIKIGQEFAVSEGDHSYEYVEILSGLNTSDILVVQKIAYNAEDILENLENE